MLLHTLLFIGGLGAPELILILLVIIIFFGAKKLPELAKGLGKGIKEFKEASKEVTTQFDMPEKSKEL